MAGITKVVEYNVALEQPHIKQEKKHSNKFFDVESLFINTKKKEGNERGKEGEKNREGEKEEEEGGRGEIERREIISKINKSNWSSDPTLPSAHTHGNNVLLLHGGPSPGRAIQVMSRMS